LAVANAVGTHVDNVIINSMIEVTTARRISRNLLATAVEIDFSVRVTDAVAAALLVSSGSLNKDKLDAELVKQVRVLLVSRSSMRVHIRYIQQNIHKTFVVGGPLFLFTYQILISTQ